MAPPAIRQAAACCAPYNVDRVLVEFAAREWTKPSVGTKNEVKKLVMFKNVVVAEGEDFLNAIPDHYWEACPKVPKAN